MNYTKHFAISAVAGAAVYFCSLVSESNTINSLFGRLNDFGDFAFLSQNLLRALAFIVLLSTLVACLFLVESLVGTRGLFPYRELPNRLSNAMLKYTNHRLNDDQDGSRAEHLAAIHTLLMSLTHCFDDSLLKGQQFRAAVFCPSRHSGKYADRLHCRMSRDANGAQNPIENRGGFFDPGDGFAGQAFERKCPIMGSAKRRLKLFFDTGFKAFPNEPNDENRSIFCMPIMKKGKCLGVLSIDSSDHTDFSGSRKKMALLEQGITPFVGLIGDHLEEIDKNGGLWLDSERLATHVES